MRTVYLRLTGANTFEWVDDPEQATAADLDALWVTLKQFKIAQITEVPVSENNHLSKWVISTDR